MFLRPNRSISLAVLIGLTLAALAQVPASADVAPGTPVTPVTPVPPTVSATLEGLPAAFSAASVAADASSPGTVVSAPAEAPIPFAMVGLELPASGSARLRTSADGVTWGPWQATEQLVSADDGPDLGTAEAARSVDVGRHTEAMWVGESRWLQVELRGADPGEVDATFIDTIGLSGEGAGSGRAAEVDGGPPLEEREAAEVVVTPAPDPTTYASASADATPMPGVISRAGWGANESIRRGSPSYAPSLRYSVVHHTAGSNTYTAAEAPAVVRGIYSYHVNTLGWSDIAYNVLVDRFGKVYEGRSGGLSRAVVGAHAKGFNTGSFGIAVMGEFTAVAPPQVALDAVADAIAWKFRVHDVDPLGSVTITSGGSNKFAAGQSISISTIFGHRDVGLTVCPGSSFYSRLPTLRSMVATRVAALPPIGHSPGSPPAPTTTVPPTLSFSDTARSVHAASIEVLVKAGVTKGCGGGRFCPDAELTRGQAVSLLVRASGRALPPPSRRFSDVGVDHIHASAISAAVDAGFITGFADGTFRPEALVTREQLATILARAKGLERRAGRYFSDVPWTSPHLAYINAIGEAHLSEGCGGGHFCPTRSTTRGQMATFVAEAFGA